MSRSQSGTEYQLTLTQFEVSHTWSRRKLTASSSPHFQEGRIILDGSTFYAVF